VTVVAGAIDPHTRCAHYHSALDIVAIRMACCGEYYACLHCHEELADHPSTPWSVGAEFNPGCQVP